MSHSTTQQIDVAIIGAGWYGLVAARTYLRLEPKAELLIIDNDSTVGGVWSKDRLYSNLVAQVRHGLFNYTDTPMLKEGSTKDNMVTGNMIHNYLQKYAEDHDLLSRIRFNTFVERAERCPHGWRLHFRDSQDQIETQKLMMATGVTSIPRMPELETNDGSVPMIHSRDLGSCWQTLDSEKFKEVIVLGAAKSAYDAVYLLLKMKKRVTWIIRPHGAGPLAILPSEILGFWNSIAVASTRMMTYLSPSILNSEGYLSSFFHRSWLGRGLTNVFWNSLNFISANHAGYAAKDHVAELKPEIGGKSIFWANSGLGVVTLPGFWQTIHDGDVQVLREDPAKVLDGGLHFSSGKSVKTDYIVACTGWGDHFGMFDNTFKDEAGLPIISNGKIAAMEDPSWEVDDSFADQTVNGKLPMLARAPNLSNPQTIMVPQRKWRLFRRAIPFKLALENDRSLAILGQIHTVQTPLVSEMQSFWTILYLLGEIDLPKESVMRKEISEWNAWTRKRYLSQGQKFPYSLYDFLPYVDTLCKDLGINSRRKGNPISEFFSPYKPEDFNGFIEEYIKSRNGRRRDGRAF